MDINEQIVRAWLEIEGFLVKSRLKYEMTSGKYKGVSDIDLIAYRLYDGKRVAVDISAWMTQNITLSMVTKEEGYHYYRLFKSSLPEARAAIRKEFGIYNDNQYEIWLVVSYLSPQQREQVEAECLQHVNRVIEFPEIMRTLVKHIQSNSGPTQESEALQTIRALVLSEILK